MSACALVCICNVLPLLLDLFIPAGCYVPLLNCLLCFLLTVSHACVSLKFVVGCDRQCLISLLGRSNFSVHLMF